MCAHIHYVDKYNGYTCLRFGVVFWTSQNAGLEWIPGSSLKKS